MMRSTNKKTTSGTQIELKELRHTDFSNFKTLPTEITDYIFSFLDARALIKLTSLNFFFSRLRKNDSYWKRIVIELLSTNPKLTSAESYFQFFQKKSTSLLGLKKLLLKSKPSTEEIFAQLHLAAVNGLDQYFLMLLKKYPDCDLTNSDGRGSTLAHAAVISNNEVILKIFIDKNLNIIAAPRAGLMVSPSISGDDTERRWWEAGAGPAPLADAAALGAKECMELLLAQKNVDVNLTDTICGRTALHYAAQGGHLACIKLLVEKGALLDAKDSDDYTPYNLAKHGEGMDYLREKMTEKNIPIKEPRRCILQ